MAALRGSPFQPEVLSPQRPETIPRRSPPTYSTDEQGRIRTICEPCAAENRTPPRSALPSHRPNLSSASRSIFTTSDRSILNSAQCNNRRSPLRPRGHPQIGAVLRLPISRCLHWAARNKHRPTPPVTLPPHPVGIEPPQGLSRNRPVPSVPSPLTEGVAQGHDSRPSVAREGHCPRRPKSSLLSLRQ